MYTADKHLCKLRLSSLTLQRHQPTGLVIGNLYQSIKARLY